MPARDGSHATASRRRSAWEWCVAVKWPVSLATVIVLLVVVQLIATLGGPAYLVGPIQVAQTFISELPRLAELSAHTLGRILAGFVIGASLGWLLGLLSGVARVVHDLTGPVVSLTYPLPKIALFPAIAVILGYTDVSRILIIALAAFYPAYLAAVDAGRSIDPNLLNLARNAGMSRWSMFWSVVVRASLPRVLTGLRISLAASFVLGYIAEALGGTGSGLGFRIVLVAQTDNYSALYAVILCFAIFGILGDRILLAVGRRLTRGQDLEVVGDAR